MSRLSTALRIGAPAAAVFDLIADPSRSSEWQTLLAEMGERAGRPGGVGSSFVGTYRVARRRIAARFVVTAAERPTLFQVNGAATGGWARWTTVIEPVGDAACDVRVELEYELPGMVVGSILAVVTGKHVAREFRRTYETLRRVAEAAHHDAALDAAGAGAAGAGVVAAVAAVSGQLASS
jgi:hypothetical protein